MSRTRISREKKSLCNRTGFRVSATEKGFARLLEILRGRIVAALGDHIDVGPVDAHIDVAEFVVVDRLVAQVAKRVLVAGLFGDLGVAPLNAVHVALGVIIAASGDGVPVKNVVVDAGERNVDAVNPFSAPVPRVAHQRAVDGDLVGLQVADDFFPTGLAAVLLAIGDDEDDAPAILGTRGKLLGGGQDCVVEGVNVLMKIELPDGLRRPPAADRGQGNCR